MKQHDSNALPEKKQESAEKTKEKKVKRVYLTPEIIKLDVKETHNAGPTFLDTGAFS